MCRLVLTSQIARVGSCRRMDRRLVLYFFLRDRNVNIILENIVLGKRNEAGDKGGDVDCEQAVD